MNTAATPTLIESQPLPGGYRLEAKAYKKRGRFVVLIGVIDPAGRKCWEITSEDLTPTPGPGGQSTP